MLRKIILITDITNLIKLSQQLKLDKILRSVVDYLWGENINIKIPKGVTFIPSLPRCYNQ